MFRFHKTKDIITLFHKPSSPASTRVANLLRQASANASQGATLDQASDHSAQTSAPRPEFDLEVTEADPTPDQLSSILEYVQPNQVGSVIGGASTVQEAIKKFRESAGSFQRPVIVDWNNGKATTSQNESEILKMLSEIKKD